MKHLDFSIILLISGLLFGACGAKKEISNSKVEDIPTIAVKPMIKGGEDVRAIPNATIFKMSGDYSGNVAITLNEDGTLAYYPDPTDITAVSQPCYLGNGWYLNRQGVSQNSVFTNFTFDQYRNLKTIPTHQELIEAIIPGAIVTKMIEIPVSSSEAIRNPQICVSYIPEE